MIPRNYQLDSDTEKAVKKTSEHSLTYILTKLTAMVEGVRLLAEDIFTFLGEGDVSAFCAANFDVTD
jgi:hypothetical protein